MSDKLATQRLGTHDNPGRFGLPFGPASIVPPLMSPLLICATVKSHYSLQISHTMSLPLRSRSIDNTPTDLGSMHAIGGGAALS